MLKIIVRDYRNAVWDAVKCFDTFNIKVVPQEEKTLVDELLVIASTFDIPKSLPQQECKVEVLFRTSVLDNQDHW